MQRWIILPDPHTPYHDKRSLAAVEKYMAAHKFDGWLCLGDLLELNEISRHVIGKPGAIKERIGNSFDVGRGLLAKHRGILGKKCRMVLIEGNHEYRTVDYGFRHPELKGFLDVPKNLCLKQLGVEWVPFWSRGKILKLGNSHWGHGRYTGEYHAKKHLMRYGVCFYYGHTHDVSLHPWVMEGKNKTLEAGAVGCLCRYDMQYMQGAPSKWQQAVSTLFLQPGGNYNLYVSRIFNHRFVGPDGVMYSG